MVIQIIEYWVRMLLTDRFCEFINQEVINFAEKFIIVLITTAANLAWSNGIIKGYNDGLGN